MERDMEELAKRIRSLARQKNAVILAHNYQRPEIQDIADLTGDSLELSIKASRTDADMIVFCGVHFMAETAAILCPSKKVVLPVATAGCAMAEMITAEDLLRKKAGYPGGAGRHLREFGRRRQGGERHLLHLGKRHTGRPFPGCE